MTNWFQSDECLNFYNDLSFVESFSFEVKREGVVKGRIVGYIQKDGGPIKRYLSRRAIINGGPMLDDDTTESEIKELLTICSNRLRRKAIYIESRNFEDYNMYKKIFDSCDWKYELHYDFHIDTSSLSVIEENLGKSRKRDIRTSLRDGATVSDADNHEDIKEFYQILSELYAQKVKTPLFPFEFFERLFKAPFGKIFVVKYNGHVVGGTACVCGNETVYEWFVCGKDNVAKSVFPSTLATYAGIKFAAENGYKRFDMMGAGAPGDGGYGVRDFKAKFGGDLVEYGRFKYVINKPLYYLGSMAVKIMKKL